jgi:tRNA nucleotidyltransferase (CCA-adding enzyme)
MSRNIAEQIAEYVREAGGRAFYVGGYVRDRLLGTENKDVDIEVHGIEPDALFELLKNPGEPLTYGKSF